MAVYEIGNCDRSGPPLHSPRPFLSVQFFTNWPVNPMGSMMTVKLWDKADTIGVETGRSY